MFRKKKDKKLCSIEKYETLTIEQLMNLIREGFSCECNADEQCVFVYDRR